MCESHLYIGIDPGKNGGVALLGKEKDYYRPLVFRCPDTEKMHKVLIENIVEFCIDYKYIDIIIEKVWAFPTDARSSAFKFGFNYGVWIGIINSIQIPKIEVVPRKWMSYYNMPPKLDKNKRKKWLKDLAEKLYPNIKITYNTSDAILIANYLKEIKEKN